MMVRRHTPPGLLLLTLTMLGAPATVGAQPGTATVRIALVSQWVVTQHRTGSRLGGERRLAPEFRAALDGGVVDRVSHWLALALAGVAVVAVLAMPAVAAAELKVGVSGYIKLDIQYGDKLTGSFPSPGPNDVPLDDTRRRRTSSPGEANWRTLHQPSVPSPSEFAARPPLVRPAGAEPSLPLTA